MTLKELLPYVVNQGFVLENYVRKIEALDNIDIINNAEKYEVEKIEVWDEDTLKISIREKENI